MKNKYSGFSDKALLNELRKNLRLNDWLIQEIIRRRIRSRVVGKKRR